MKFRNRDDDTTTISAAEPDAYILRSLPDGHDDPESVYFVPDILEPAYQRFDVATVEPTTAARSHDRAREYLGRAAAEEYQRAHPQPVNEGRRGGFVLDERESREWSPKAMTKRIDTEQPAAVAALTSHFVIMKALLNDAGKRAQVEQRESDRLYRTTCPECGDRFDESNALLRVESRPITLMATPLRLCGPCAIVFSAHMVASSGRAIGADGRTRDDVARQWLDRISQRG
ncbi:hypothetical protein ACPPVQ_08420 [Diaminobutyricibacter sp. McL0618]|uniref:hypothetical protein n=1 Tax=Leifsonia sp. McL0618 TaxID=3415677 RepID=UPI003CFA0DB0